MTIEDLAACMLAEVPDGTSPLDVLKACVLIVDAVIGSAPANLQRDITERFVSDVYKFVLEES